MNEDIHQIEDAFIRNLRLHRDNPALVSLTEEVRERKKKPKTDPTSVQQKLPLGDFNTAMVHFYRGEISRSNTWRLRLDTTTNWAVITAGVIFNVFVVFLALGTLRVKHESSEVQSKEEFEWHAIQQVSSWADSIRKKRNRIRRAKKARQRTSAVIHRAEV